MADVLGKLTVEIVGDNSDLEKDIKQSQKSTEKFGKNTEKLGKSLGKLFTGIAFAAVAKKLFDLGKAAENLFKVQELAEKKLDATLEATAFAAGLTADQLKRMATELQGVTTFGDEAIIGAQSLLLTFKSIGEDVFPDALESILNVSEAMGQDLKSSTIQIGKALNDPVAGLAALSRVGIQFTDVQKDLIKGFAESGDIASAQGVILEELEGQFGGVARAAAETADGVSIQLSNSIGDLGEVIGSLISESMTPWRKSINEVVMEFTTLITKAKDVNDTIKDLEDGSLDADTSMGTLTDTLAKLNAERAAGAALGVNRELEKEIAAVEGLIAAYGIEDTFLIKAAESKLALARAGKDAADKERATLELEEQIQLRLAELRAAELTDTERQIASLNEQIEQWVEFREVAGAQELINELVWERNRLLEEGTEEIEAQTESAAMQSEVVLFGYENQKAGHTALTESIVAENSVIQESFESIAELGLGSILNGFEAIGEAMVQGGLDAKLFGKFALGALGEVLSALGAQLAAQAALAFFTFPFNIPAGIGLTSASAAAFTAGGVIKAAANSFEDGGVVAGSSFTGDNVPIFVNSGEEVLRRDDPRHRFNQGNITNNNSGGNTTINNTMFALGNEPGKRQAAKTLFPYLVKEGQRRGTSII